MPAFAMGGGNDPSELAYVLAEVIADEDASEMTRMTAHTTALDLIIAGSLALALSTDAEHKEICEDHDHTPAGYMEFLAEHLRERDAQLDFEKTWQMFWDNKNERKALKSLEDLPDELHVSDILGEEK